MAADERDCARPDREGTPCPPLRRQRRIDAIEKTLFLLAASLVAGMGLAWGINSAVRRIPPAYFLPDKP